MAEVKAHSCSICGAPLDPPDGGGTVTCSYCGTKLTASSGRQERAGETREQDLVVGLLQGYGGGPVGEGRRYGPKEMLARDWKCWERGVWPVEATASSTFGRGWKPSAVVGAPSVYPSCGDRAGAWAPGTRHSRVEWIEARYDPAAPEVEAIRVFETCVPGATFAVTVRSNGAEELVWKAPPRDMGNTSQVLEIPLDPPRKVAAVRAWVSNELGSRWSEIDTIGLVATGPVPETMRRKPRRVRSGCIVWTVLGLLVLVGVGLGWLAGLRGGCASELETPAARVDGTQMMVWNTDVAGTREAGTVWAASGVEASSQYGRSKWSAGRAAGLPDVFPAHQDDPDAWAPKKPDGGMEWVTVEFSVPTPASAIVVVETFHPGALVRIDDLTDEPAILWQGSTTVIESSRILSLELSEPREIRRIRLVADTRRVNGWYAVDAVGLVPPQ